MEQPSDYQSPPGPPLAAKEAVQPPWPPLSPAVQPEGRPAGQMRAPVPVEYRRPFRWTFSPAVYESANHRAGDAPSRAAAEDRPESGRRVRGEPGYIGRHRGGHVPGHLAPDQLHIGFHRLALFRPDYVSVGAWLDMTDVQRRRRVPAWWLIRPNIPAQEPAIPYVPVPLDTPTPIADSVEAFLAVPPPEAASEPAAGLESKPPVRPVRPIPVPTAIRRPTPPAEPGAHAGAEAALAEQHRHAGAQRAGAAAWLGVQAQRVRDWFNDPEKGRGRKALAAMAGTLTLAAAAAGIYFAVRHGGPHPTIGRSPSGSGVVPVTPSHEILPPATTVTLTNHADTIWEGVFNYARSQGVHLGPDQEALKHHIVGEVLHDNGQTWESARHLPEGYQFVITPQRAQEIQSLR